MEMSAQFHAPAALPPGQEPPVPIEQDAGWAPIRSGRSGVDKTIIPLLGIEPRLSIPKPVAIPTELSRLKILNIYITPHLYYWRSAIGK
jgi:hypothetical protein